MPAIRLERWSFHPVRLPYRKPVRWSDGTVVHATDFLLLRLHDSDGGIGVGELNVKAEWAGTSLRSAIAILDDVFLPAMTKIDLADEAALLRNLALIPDNLCIKALLDNAVWDLRANRAAARLPAPPSEDPIAMSWTLTRQAPEPMAREAAGIVEQYGINFFKVKGGQGFETDFAAIAAVTAAIGPGRKLYVDANAAYDREQGALYVRRMAELGHLAIEDPYALRPDGFFQKTQEATALPIVVDFNCPTEADTELFLERGMRALSLKPGRVGISRARAMAELAAAAGCKCHVGLFGESAFGTIAGLQFAASLPDHGTWLPAELTIFEMYSDHFVNEPLKIENGAVQLPQAVSGNDQIDWQKVASLAYA